MSEIFKVTVNSDTMHQIQQLAYLFFPKYCSSCGKFFVDVEAYKSFTGFSEDYSEQSDGQKTGAPYKICLYDHCVCGKKLSDTFSTKKDLTPAGVKRRSAFGEVMVLLSYAGLQIETARTELLNVMRGKGSVILNIN